MNTNKVKAVKEPQKSADLDILKREVATSMRYLAGILEKAIESNSEENGLKDLKTKPLNESILEVMEEIRVSIVRTYYAIDADKRLTWPSTLESIESIKKLLD